MYDAVFVLTGTWNETSDEIRWIGQDQNQPVVWRSVARYCTSTNVYCGRTPYLQVDRLDRSFDEAVAFAERLGQRSKWMRPEQERNLRVEQNLSAA